MLYERWIKEWKSALAENFFLRVLCLMLACGMVVNVVALRGKDRIVIVPPKIEREFWIDENRVSESYLEQMALFFATFAANMSPSSAEYNAKILASYTDPSAYAEFKNEIGGQAAYFKKNNITQAFFPEATKIYPDEGRVEIMGQAMRYVGQTKISTEKVIVNVKMRVKNYTLRIEELYMTYPEREQRKIKQTEEQKLMTPEERKRGVKP